MKTKAQNSQIIRNRLGPSRKAKPQKAQITRNRLGPAAANQWKKKLKTFKSSEIDYGDPCTQKLKKLESLEIWGPTTCCKSMKDKAQKLQTIRNTRELGANRPQQNLFQKPKLSKIECGQELSPTNQCKKSKKFKSSEIMQTPLQTKLKRFRSSWITHICRWLEERRHAKTQTQFQS